MALSGKSPRSKLHPLHRLRSLYESGLYFLYPPFCLNCQALFTGHDANYFFCPQCWGKLPLLREPRCPVCLEEIDFYRDEIAGGSHCGTCLKRRYAFSRLYSCLEFHGMARTALNHFKFGHKPKLALPLSQVILQNQSPDFVPSRYDYLVPVPISWQRRWRRGYNQTLKLAAPLCAGWNIPLLNGVLLRAKDKSPLSRVHNIDRFKYVRGCFKVDKKETIAGKRILLFDDIATSRATLNECAKVLKKAGAQSVDAYTCAVSVK